jgi:hypothetical protein
VLHVAAATVPAKATLEQLEEEELDDKEPVHTPRGGLRCLGQYYATQLKRRTMAHLRADLKVDDQLRQDFEKLLEEDGMDSMAWDEVAKWYDTKRYDIVTEPYERGRPVGVSLASFSMLHDAWVKHFWKPIPATTESDDEYDEQHY